MDLHEKTQLFNYYSKTEGFYFRIIIKQFKVFAYYKFCRSVNQPKNVLLINKLKTFQVLGFHPLTPLVPGLMFYIFNLKNSFWVHYFKDF